MPAILRLFRRAALCAGLSLLCLSEAQAQCAVAPAAVFRLIGEGRPVIAVTINSYPTQMLVDTGADGTTLTPETQQALNLPTDPRHRSIIRSVAGEESRPHMLVSSLAAGPLNFGPMSLASVPLDPPDRPTRQKVAGLLGMDLVGRYDIEIDLPRHILALYPTGVCVPAEPPWSRGSYTTVEITASPRRRALVPVLLNGRRLTALLDTGAELQLLTRDAAERLGLSTVEIDTAGGVAQGMAAGGHPFSERVFKFGTFTVAGETFRDVTFPISAFRQEGIDMLLGANYMKSRRLFLSPATGRLYVQTAAGRPVASAPTQATLQPGPPQGTAPPGTSPGLPPMASPQTPPQIPPLAPPLAPPPATAADRCRPPPAMLPLLSREQLAATFRPRLLVPDNVRFGLTDGCAGVTFHVAADGTVQQVEVVAEWPAGYGIGEYVRRELEATRFQPPTGGVVPLHYEMHRLHLQ